MTGSVLIDSHTHTQPTAEEAKTFVGRYGFDSDRLGTVGELLMTMDRGHVTRSMIVPWVPAQQLVAEQVGRGVDYDQAVARL